MTEKISLVQTANIKDERTSEMLRRELSDLMHQKGWNLNSLYDAFNKHRKDINKRHIHINNLKSALAGVKKHRPLADMIEKYITQNDGPYIDLSDHEPLPSVGKPV